LSRKKIAQFPTPAAVWKNTDFSISAALVMGILEIRRHSTTYLFGILLPMIRTTFAGFLAFAANPDSGERIGLGITCLLTSAAIYIVAFEVLPKTGPVTAITMIHVVSFSFSWATLAVSVISVSLYAVKNSTGAMSEHELMQAFVKADDDNSGALDKKEVERAVKKLGLKPDVAIKLKQTLDEASGDSGQVTLPVWYELVGEIYETDGIAAYYSPIVGRLLGPAVRGSRTPYGLGLKLVSRLHRMRMRFLHSIAPKALDQKHWQIMPEGAGLPRELVDMTQAPVYAV